jgi:hypothetical protein
MTATGANPDLLVDHYTRANRVADWRARTGELAFQLAAGGAFLGAGLWAADGLWSVLLDPRAAWARPMSLALIAAVCALAIVLRSRSMRQSLARQHSGDWLAAQPISWSTRRHARRRRTLTRACATVLATMLLIGYAVVRSENAGSLLSLALAAGCIAGLALAAMLPESYRSSTLTAWAPPTRASAVSVPAQTAGLAILGAALEPMTARMPKTAPWLALSFLLFPPSTPLIALPALILLFTALSASLDLVVHWRQRFLADQAWLAAQPLPARQLFGAYGPWLVRRALPWSLAFGICLFAIGAPPLAAAALALALLTALFDAILCGYATRMLPWRFPLLLMLHGLVVLSTLQVLPPALPLVVGACALTAWRQGNR